MEDAPPVERAPAPWTLKAESYLLFLKLQGLPEGVYDTLEEAWEDEGMGRFEGGLGAIMIVRYTDTPVGSYDELMLIPGNFSVPHPSSGPPKIPRKALRIARIYVSQRTTTYNGRLNWNIPKHLARFSFSEPVTPAGATPPQDLVVKVYAPGTEDGDGVQPFFACKLTPWRWVPAVPFKMSWAPISMVQVQPPIPEPTGHKRAVVAELEDRKSGVKIDPYDISPRNEVAVAVGTDRWCAFDIGGNVQRARGCWVEVLNAAGGSDEEQRYWPKGVKPWAVGGWLEDAVLEIEKPLEWKLHNTPPATCLTHSTTRDASRQEAVTTHTTCHFPQAPTLKMVPAPYSVRWTSKLICRDLKNIAANCTSKVKKLFSSSSTPCDQIKANDELVDAVNLHDDASTNASISASTNASFISHYSTTPTEVSRATPEVSSTTPEVSNATPAVSSATPEVSSATPVPGSIYGLLSTKLAGLYACRVRNQPLNERWTFRGAWLILHLATQYCASNPSYDILEAGSSKVSETALVSKILLYSLSNPLDNPTSCVDAVPSVPDTKHDDSTRHDSLFSTASVHTPTAPPALLWYFIWAGATDSTKTVRAAECLLNHLWADKDALALLEVAGNPAKRLSEDEEMELREPLGRMLCPERHVLDGR
ncbi:hypothetical protein OPT61_g5522 [Boeremia exigua]|uniref:Uncharacterized protein n=1 Tax=Boeremia exigua TaxID=749465 RepID=A0ACC2IA03_9PLEO|nr:hypothetical protein OPT61_g5522 [Boeremia exigua]